MVNFGPLLTLFFCHWHENSVVAPRMKPSYSRCIWTQILFVMRYWLSFLTRVRHSIMTPWPACLLFLITRLTVWLPLLNNISCNPLHSHQLLLRLCVATRQVIWARSARARLREALGSYCAKCGATTHLEFHCIVPQGHEHHGAGITARTCFYRRQHRNHNLQLLCPECHAIATALEHLQHTTERH